MGNSSEDISYISDVMLREADALTNTYVKEAKRNFPEFIYVHRFEYSARRSYIMNKALAEACEIRRTGTPSYPVQLHNFAVTTNLATMQQTFRDYDQLTTDLTDGVEDKDIPPLITQRDDIVKQEEIVKQWTDITKKNLECVAD